jgi:hypothetical protein
MTWLLLSSVSSARESPLGTDMAYVIRERRRSQEKSLQETTKRDYFMYEGLAVDCIHLQPDGEAHRKLGFGWPLSPFST